MIGSKGRNLNILVIILLFVFIQYDTQGKERNERKALVVVEAGDDTTTTSTATITERKKCVIFAGPMKTGCTALENFIWRPLGKSALTKDGYIDYGRQSIALSHCLHDQTQKYDKKCKGILDDFKSFISANSGKSNILIAHENYAEPGLNVNELTSYLSSDYDVHVVLNYRRFYDWIYSMYNQRNKPRQHRHMRMIPTFASYLSNNMEKEYRLRYALSNYHKYTSAQGISKVSLINMHHDATNHDTVESFACDQLDDAPHFCEAAKSRPPDEHSNPSKPLSWFMFRQKLSEYHPTEQLDDASWQKIEEKFHSIDDDDKPKVCLSGNQKDRLLELSLDSETALTPESFYNSDEGLEALKSDFERKIETTFCDIDVEAIAMSPEWKDFFEESLSRN